MPERYELIRHIANGGMASVWCAEDRVLGRRVAIKLLAERFAHDQTAVRRFKREARTAARLSGHPQRGHDLRRRRDHDSGSRRVRAGVHRHGVPRRRDGGRRAAVRCGDRRPRRSGGCTRWPRRSTTPTAAASLHRDIKPANVLLDGNRSVHVADFGIAQLATEDTLTADGELLGTAAYLAPERAMGRPATDASDRYSLAVMAFELLVGERPFTDQRFAVQARQHVDAPPPSASERNPRLPEALDAVLARGMAKRPEDRFPTAHALAEAVETALAEPATSATTRRRCSRQPAAQRHPRRERGPTRSTPAAGRGCTQRPADLGRGAPGLSPRLRPTGLAHAAPPGARSRSRRWRQRLQGSHWQPARRTTPRRMPPARPRTPSEPSSTPRRNPPRSRRPSPSPRRPSTRRLRPAARRPRPPRRRRPPTRSRRRDTR